MIQDIVQRFSAVLFSEYIHLEEIPLFIHGHAAVVKQVGVIDLVKASLGKKETDMPLELLAMHKGVAQTFHHLLLLRSETVRILRIHRGEIHILHGIFRSADSNRFLFIIYFIQKQPVGHIEFRPFFNQLSLQLELDDGNGLMHLLIQLQVLRVVVLSIFNGKNIAVGIRVSIHGKGGERNEIDAVAFLQDIEIAVSG